MKKIKYLVILLLLFPFMVNASSCTIVSSEPTLQYHVDEGEGAGRTVTYGSGEYNKYCLGIEGCLAKNGTYYDMDSNSVSLQDYYQSCGCRKVGDTYYDNQNNVTTEGDYNRICLQVGKCSIKNGHYYGNDYKEVTEQIYKQQCGCRIENDTYYDKDNQVTSEENYNQVCLEVGKCSIKNGHYYGNDYKEVTEEVYKQQCGCRKEDDKYYDDNGAVTTEETYNRVCLNAGKCSKKDGKFYDNNYKETTEEEYKKICGCRKEDNKYYDKNGEETTQKDYNAQCVNPRTGTTSAIVIVILTFGIIGGSLFIVNRKKQINELS